MNASDYDPISMLDRTIVCMYKYLLPVFYIIGIVGNLLTASIFLRRSWSRNVCVLYFQACLLVSLLYMNSTILGRILLVGYHINVLNFHVVICKLLPYSTFALGFLIPTILTLATIDRLLISSRDVDTRLYSSRRLAYFSIGTGSVFWLVFNVHILIKTGIQQLAPSHFTCYYELSHGYLQFVSYSIMSINTLLCVLTMILSALAFQNVRSNRPNRQQQRRQLRPMTKKDFQLLRCLFAQDVLYVSLSALVCVYFIYSTATQSRDRTLLEQAVDSFVSDFLGFFYYTFYCGHIFVYAYVSKAFRHELKRMVQKAMGSSVPPPPATEDCTHMIVVAVSTIEIPS